MTDTLKQKEINLYGSSRLGIYNVDIDVQNCNIASPEITKFTRGNKSYELSNHLGNVLATISDKHVQVAAPGSTVVDYYLAEVLTATDYYPFGMQMPQRQFYIDTSTYIVGTTSTTTSENNTTVVELYKHSFNDTPSVHPYVTVPTSLNSNLSGSTWTNSRNMWTNYASNTSMGKAIAFDNSTADTATVTLTLNIASNKKVGIKSFSFYNRVSNSGYRHWKMFINGIEVGDSTLYYPATGGTGNNTVKTTGTVPVKNAVEDLTGTITVLLKLYDHDAAYPNGNAQGTFRMDDFVLNGYVNDDGGSSGSGYQYANKGGYRYGFNGQEKSDEIKGEGNSYTAEYWEYDPRIGRRWNLDPKPDVSLSPYSTFGNNPIYNSDPYVDTLTNPQILAAIKIANNEISSRIKAGKGFGLQSKNYVKPLSDAMKLYLDDNPVSKGDLVGFYNAVHRYYDALAGAAMMSTKDYSDYNREILGNVGLGDASKIRLTNKYVTEANRNLLGVITLSANVALGEAAGALAPNVGPAPRGVTQRLSFSDVAFQRYLTPERTVPITDLRRAISSKGQPDPQGVAGYKAYYTPIIKNGNAYNLKVVYNEGTNTIVHFQYSRASLGGLPKIPTPKKQ